MVKPAKNPGRRGEDLAVRFLKSHGYKILQRNFRCRAGEIDVVACDGDTVCFVEVKSRQSEEYGGPESALTKKQERHIVNAALFYLSRKRAHGVDCRFDVVSVLLQDPEPEIELFQGAFRPEIQLP